MMMRAFEISRELGYHAMFLCGDPNFYHKIGFLPTYHFGIYHINDKDKNAEWSMVYELTEGALSEVKGTVNTN